jgi:predicted DNA-binding transcriptional regulator AlpA
MPTQIITLSDLHDFRHQLLRDLKEILSNSNLNQINKKWINSKEVMEILQISSSTLQNYRVNGTLPFSKIAGKIYYDMEDIQKIIIENKV